MNIKSLSMIVGTFLAFQTVSFAQLESKGATKTVHTSAPKLSAPKLTTYKPIGKKTIAKTATQKVAPSGAIITFEKSIIDLGTIKEDAVIVNQFEFTNTGVKPLVITSAKGTCGCTAPEYPKTPILPSEKGVITVTYTAKNKVGPQKPEITVTTNGTPSTVKIKLEAWVDQIPGGVKD
ncbi:MAG: hypothetical protein RIS64_1855 [Bacteroidota bacterium]|jgi:hypothetical protein